MPFITSKELLREAKRSHYAIGAFNIENMEMARAAVWTAEKMKAPIILQTTPSTVKYAGLKQFAVIVRALAESASVPVVLHLDHAKEIGLTAQAIVHGYSSVMIDASEKPFRENLETVKQVMLFAGANQIPVEAELGKISGKEDSHTQAQDVYTDPEEALEFVAQTQVDSLAVAIGTAHGIYQSAPHLNKPLLAELNARLELPLVLHGASGLSEEDITDCVKLGICKVNFATDLRIAYTAGIKRALKEDDSVFDPKALGKAGMAAVEEVIAKKITLCGCAGKG